MSMAELRDKVIYLKGAPQPPAPQPVSRLKGRHAPLSPSHRHAMPQSTGKRPVALTAHVDNETCPSCNGLLLVRNDHGIGMTPCKVCESSREVQSEMVNTRFSRSDLPARYREASLKTWHQIGVRAGGKMMAYFAAKLFAETPQHLVSTHALAHLVQGAFGEKAPAVFADVLAKPDDPRSGLVLYGDYGVGKTWLAAAAMNAMVKNGQVIVYMRMQELIQTLTDTWNTAERTADLLLYYAEAPVLFIDDMNGSAKGHETLPAHQRQYCTELMRHRMNHAYPTLITTNYAPQLYSAKWGPEAGEVVREGCHWVRVAGESLREFSQWETI